MWCFLKFQILKVNFPEVDIKSLGEDYLQIGGGGREVSRIIALNALYTHLLYM